MENKLIMTRINCGIPVEELTDVHLRAEHREIKRVPNVISKGRYNLDGQPEKFTLGKGHIKFFYDKMMYLKNRYESIYLECKRRGFNMTYFGNCWDGVPKHLMNDYTPTEQDREIIRNRINERLKQMRK
jgi:hypothetical protein